MTKPFVWTVRVAEQKVPFFWLTHEGPQSVRTVEELVQGAKQNGLNVVVGFGRTA